MLLLLLLLLVLVVVVVVAVGVVTVVVELVMAARGGSEMDVGGTAEKDEGRRGTARGDERQQRRRGWRLLSVIQAS
ncbi:hypothetical protein E2C01_039456 [Portunus trituberculatus]|uniref:Uncharacterized protein n=1 Tax=Portunus trituberculatus TaxID=210409 RepID=A0A5B7FDP3_PORTR|nr:hypothetical protein [Portunus trituberculatus]